VVHERAAVFQDATRRELQRVFDANVPPGGLRKVLDAGCGYKLPIDVPRDVHLTGIDQSPDALAKNLNADELVLGDIQSHPLPAGEYDAVICWWVLEHVPDRRSALANLARSLRPGGLLVLGIPHIFSMKAFVTKITPYRFHVWVLRHFMGVENAGAPGVEPYPTYLKMDLAPARLRAQLAAYQLSPIYSATVHSGAEESLPAPLLMIWKVIARVARICTVGRWDPYSDEYVAIFRSVARPS
jgi:SAM-dependent methyltransferase